MQSRLSVGHIELTLFTEAFIHLPGNSVFYPATHREWRSCLPTEGDGYVEAAIKSLLVRTANQLMLVDTGYDNQPTAHRVTTLMEELADAGVEPGQITAVVLTHTHDDHCLGNTVFRDGRWTPAFPRAEYFVQRREASAARTANGRTWRERFEPLVQSGRLRLIDGHYTVDRGVELVPTPGHTEGHQVVKVSDGEEVALYLGDLALFAASLEQPQWGPDWAWSQHDDRTSRRDLVQWAAGTNAVLIPGHDPSLACVRVRRSARGFTAEPV